MPSKMPAYGCLALAMAIVGSSVVSGKIITHSFPVFLASGLRFALATAIMIPLLLSAEGGLPRFSRREWLILGVMALCGQVVFTCLVLYGLRLTSAVDAGLITSTTPAAMCLLSWLLLRERLGPARVSAVLMAVMGVLLVNGWFGLGGGESASPGDRWLGNLLMVLAVLGEAVFLLLRKLFPLDLSELALTAALCFLGLVMFLPPAIYQAASFDFSAVDWQAWLAIAYFGLIFTVVAYILWFRGVAQVPGGVAGVFTAVMPLAALSLSVLILREPLSWGQALGGLFVLAAIFLATVLGPQKEAAAVAER